MDSPALSSGAKGRRAPIGLIAGGAAVTAALVTLVLVLLLAREPVELTATRREPPRDPVNVEPVQVKLAEPIDRVHHIELHWSATRELDFGVIIAEEGEKPTVVYVHRNLSMKVPVEPDRKYCFQVQGTDSKNVYESQAVPVRGAICRS